MLEHVLDHVTGRTRPTSSVPNPGHLLAIFTVAMVATACSTSRPTPPPPVQAPTPTAEVTAAAALAAYGEFWRISEGAFAAPTTQNWRAELSKVARNQALDDVMLEIENYASVPAHVEGTVTRNPEIDPDTPSTEQRVAIVDCLDLSESHLLADNSGAELGEVENQPKRYRFRAQVVRDATGKWLVDATSPALAEPC
jgi:hypothetical protein